MDNYTKIINKLKTIAKEFKTRLYLWNSDDGSHGQYCTIKKRIYVARYLTYRETISAFFHELSHFLDHNEGIYKRFYLVSSAQKIHRFLALRAELHTDKRAEKLMKKYFPKVKYIKSYRNKKDIQYLRDYYKDKRNKYE